jgi:hypothetical protein
MEYSVKDIAKEALNEAKNEITSQLDKTINEVYNNYLNILKNATKEFVKQQFVTIKNALNSESEGTIEYYKNYHNNWNESQSVTYNYTITFQDTTEKQLNNAVKIFFEKIESVYNQQALNEVFIKSQEIALQKYYFKFTFEDFTSYIKNDIYQITNLAYERLRIEKSKFQSQIKIFYENAFRIIFSQFVNGKGKDYLNFAVNFDYENNIYHDFTLMRTSINHTYYIVKTLLQEPTLKGLGFNIIKTFIKVFPNIREQLEKIIPDKIENIVFPKIEIFKDNARNKIVQLFIETLEDGNNKIRKNLNSKIADLIPKYLDSPFKGKLEDIFNSHIQSTIQEMKNLYNTTILTNFEDVKKSLLEKGNTISKAMSSVKPEESDYAWSMMEIHYNGLHSGYETYEKNNVFTLKTEKTFNIESFFSNKIKPYLIEIRTEFYKSVEEGQINLVNKLKTFEVNSLVSETLSYVKSSNIINTISSYESVLTQVFLDLRNSIINQFSSFDEDMKDIVLTMNFDGFGKNNGLRHLTDYQYNSIEKAFLIIENQYKTFKKKVLESKQYVELIKNKNGLISGLSEPSSTLTNNFYAYKVILEQYTNIENVEKYFNNLEKDAEEVRKEVMTFIIDFSNVIDSNLNLIYTELRDSWRNTREGVNAKIYKTLDEIFEDKFTTLKDTSFNNSKVFKNIPIKSFDVNTKRNEQLATVNINIKELNAKYGYNIKRKGIYDFMLHVFTGGDITLDITTKLGDRLIETISGKLGSGEIGIDANYTLHDLSLDLDAYAKIDDTTYSILGSTTDNLKVYEASPYSQEKNVTMKRKIRSLFFE